jgi:hypothetical protein
MYDFLTLYVIFLYNFIHLLKSLVPGKWIFPGYGKEGRVQPGRLLRWQDECFSNRPMFGPAYQSVDAGILRHEK